MNSVFITFYEAYPPASGAASVSYSCAKYAPGGAALIQQGKHVGRSITPDGVPVVTLPWTESRAGKILGLPGRIRRIVEACREFNPHTIVLEGASWVLYHLLLLRRLRKQKVARRLVYHAHNVEYVLRRARNGLLIRTISRWAEERLLREADEVFACSDIDRDQFRSLFGVEAKLWPNGVDVARFDAVTEDEVQRVRTKYGITGYPVLFMGLYGYPPNKEAVEFLVDQVFPEIAQQYPDLRLVVLGGDIPHRAPWLINPGIILHVDLPAVVKACRIGVAPIFSGSGTRLKILEYMGAGLPVISTRKGAEGLSIRGDSDILLAESKEEWTASLLHLLADDSEPERIGFAGKELVNRRYIWSSILTDALGGGVLQPQTTIARAESESICACQNHEP